MSARGNAMGNNVSVIQSVVAVGDQCYTVLAMRTGDDVLSSHDAREFIGSLRILKERAGGPGLDASNTSRMREEPKTFVALIDSLLAILFGLVLLFVAYGAIVLLKRWLRRHEPVQQKSTWINLYAIFAAICAFGGAAGCWGNVKFLMRETELATDPLSRQAFIMGMFVPPVLLIILTLILALLARRKARKNSGHATISTFPLAQGPSPIRPSATDSQKTVPD